MKIFGVNQADQLSRALKKMEDANVLLQRKLRHSTMALYYLISVLEKSEIEDRARVQKRVKNIFEGDEEFEIPN